jgi:D-alanine-D-alanine ligase
MNQRLRVALLYGGPSGEHEIALRSAASVLSHLCTDRYQIIPIGMDKKGCCFYTPYEQLCTYKESLPVKIATSEPLPGLTANGKFVIDTDVVFPIVHGPLLEDGALQGLLELSQVAYVGSGVLASAIGMDKDITRRLVGLDGIQFAKYRALSIHAQEGEKLEFYKMIARELDFPVFVKPCCMGSSVGIHKVTEENKLEAAVQNAFHYDETILVEQNVVGKEIEIAVLENEQAHLPPLVSMPGELKIHHPDGFYSYAAKYIDSEQTELCIPANLADNLIKQLQASAATIFTRLKCKGMARVDFFVNDQTSEIYFNEINTLPGFTSISMYPRLWEASGLEYTQLIDKLIQLACSNYHIKQQLVRDYQ